MELLMHGGEHHEIGDGGWLMMTMAADSPLRSPEWTPDQPSREVLWLVAAPYCKTRGILLSDFFSPRTRIYGVGVEVGGAPGGPRGRGRAQGAGMPPTLVDRWWPPPALILSPIFLIFSKNKFRGVSGHSENFYFCTKGTPWQFC